jgi:hypothetical protein
MLQVIAQDFHNPDFRFAIPKWRPPELRRGVLENRLSGPANAIRLHSDHLVRSVINCRGPFRVLTQREARHAEHRGFLLYSAGVCEDNACAIIERKEIEISERIERHNARAFSTCFGQMSCQTKTLDILARPGMNGEEDRKLGRNSAHCAENILQRLGVVYVGRPVQSENAIAAAARPVLTHTEPLEKRRSCCHFPIPQQAVDHDIADEEDFLRRHAFALPILDATLLGDKKQIGN